MDALLAARLTVAVRRLSHRYRQLTERHLSDLDLRAGQEVLISIVARRVSLTQTELAAELDVEPPTVATMLRRLEPLGLIERRSDPSDSRAVQVALTDKGHRTARTLEELTTDVATEATGTIPAAELDDLVSSLEKLAGAVPAVTHARRDQGDRPAAKGPGGSARRG